MFVKDAVMNHQGQNQKSRSESLAQATQERADVNVVLKLANIVAANANMDDPRQTEKDQ